ncbi:DUF1178 family protein [Acetobacter cerevisiae]|uniref:DUF1178 family protein n=1 Tax=Acetobacter cerevisiae TaxID=178900 RepID=A0A149Q3L9_9PROT|nr:DUF1178 family protein [Acetobacter cerevisiae]KXU91767.1 hypothetical protein AD928_13700 [Acetobacter cerevisiae]KXV73115.1 hypothetical protein AD952_00470 [Acetobacter cerevisiae]MCP1244555.1 DUF1178 family protein [Acetobacter cerevisiae]MCP1254132.1 DUF1178 family protein [Acetobacter cerevisiae]GBQ06671.1 hypothetical protein AA14362_0974 [Acetobacter cerevisiae DSM 14362]
MICYRLRCAAGHEFEGWYRDSATFAQLQAGGFLSCPECGHADVQQALMAPAISKKCSDSPAPRQSPESSVEGATEKAASAVLPDQMVAAFQKIRQAVETGCENVGDRFAEEALRMHHKEAPERGIYGQASEEDRSMLADEGVDVLSIPWVRRADG